jgi:hypothetical protein
MSECCSKLHFWLLIQQKLESMLLFMFYAGNDCCVSGCWFLLGCNQTFQKVHCCYCMNGGSEFIGRDRIFYRWINWHFTSCNI